MKLLLLLLVKRPCPQCLDAPKAGGRSVQDPKIGVLNLEPKFRVLHWGPGLNPRPRTLKQACRSAPGGWLLGFFVSIHFFALT